jgi:integrase
MATKKQPEVDRPAPAGTVEWRGERAYARLLLVDGSRPRVPLGKGLSKAEAERQKDELQVKAWSERWAKPAPDAPPGPGGETMAAWFKRYFAHREERKIKGLRQERSRFETHLKPTFGERPIASVTRHDLEAFVSELDTRVRAGELSWRSALHSWALLAHGFKEAQGSKRLDLRAREDNPAAGVRGPDRGRDKTKQLLYPSEVTAILSCDRVPIRWKRLIALAVYTYLRPGELAALDWEAVDLEHGVAHVHQAESDEGETLDTKTGTTRLVPIEPTLVPLLDVLRREQGRVGRLVRSMPPEEDLSERLRKYAKWAGVTRAALFVPAKHKTIKRLTWYDLRATGITWRAVRGDSPTKIHIAAGHDEFTTTLGYIRLAEGAAHGFGEPFPPLPPCLQSTSAVHPDGDAASNSGEDRGKSSVLSGIRSRLQSGNTGPSGPSPPVDPSEGPRKPSEGGEWTGQWTDPAALEAALLAALRAGDLDAARALLDRSKVGPPGEPLPTTPAAPAKPTGG